MQLSLFKDSETFIKERPVQLGKTQENELWNKLANEVIKRGWSDSDIDTIIEDLSYLPKFYTGYEMAKKLEKSTSNGDYFIDTSFIEWLDMLYYNFDNVIRENVKLWVNAHNIKPKYKKETKLTITAFISPDPELKIGNEIFINNIYENEAKYCVSKTKNSKKNIVIEYEKIEYSCIVS